MQMSLKQGLTAVGAADIDDLRGLFAVSCQW